MADFSAHIEGKFEDADAMDRACEALNRCAKRYGLFLHFEYEDRAAASVAEILRGSQTDPQTTR